jgi:hypothetical protein
VIIKTLEKPDVSFDDFIQLRQIASDAAGSSVPADARIGLLLRNKIDDHINSLSADDIAGGNAALAADSLKQGRELWRRARNSQEIDQAIELAGTNANTVTGAGFENALRLQFKALERRIIKGQLNTFNAAEKAAIRTAARGGPVDNLFRLVGKAAPTGIVSGGIGSGVGFALGGPAGAIAVPAIGTAARYLATNRGINNATRASEVVRTGGLLGP